jgi:hypothetical protein
MACITHTKILSCSAHCAAASLRDCADNPVYWEVGQLVMHEGVSSNRAPAPRLVSVSHRSCVHTVYVHHVLMPCQPLPQIHRTALRMSGLHDFNLQVLS